MTALDSLLDLLPADGWRRLAVDFAWQSTLIGLAAAALLRLSRRRPALRSAVAVTAAVLFLAAPLSTGLARHYGWGFLAEPVVAELETKMFDTLPPVKMSKAPLATVALSPAAPKLSRADVVWRGVAIAWGGLSLLFLVRLTRSALAVRRLYHTAVSCEDDLLLSELQSASHALQVAAPELCTSPAMDSPALVSWGKTRLILPTDYAAIQEWRAVFCHELAHLARRDGWSRLGFEALVVVLPWQPLAWALRRVFRASCEQACDDWSVAAGADPVELAALLTDFIPQRRPALVLGMSESAPATKSRIMRLLAMQSTPQPRLGRAFALSGWLVAVVLAVMLALLQRERSGGSGGGLPPWGDSPASVAAASVHPAGDPGTRRPYRVEPPDILLIDATKVVPKPPYKIEPLDVLQIFVLGTLPDQPIAGTFSVEADGTIMLGAAYGAVNVSGLTLTEAHDAIKKHLESELTAPEVAVSLSESSGKQQIAGEHMVGPDGTVTLGTYGGVYVAGMTVAEIRAAVEKHLSEFLDKPQVSVDVYSYNSLVYYVVGEGLESGDFMTRLTWTGSETVLDAVAQSHIDERKISLGNCWVWISRPASANTEAQILPVDWQAIVEKADKKTNWQLLPGDRIFIRRRAK